MRHRKRRSLELSVIFIASMLLLISVVGLCVRAVTVQGRDAFPGLYAPGRPETELSPGAVYLTFDDGPSDNTERILDILKERGAKATFFVTAQAESREYLNMMLRRIVREGHTLGLHSSSHNFSKIYANPEAYLKDIDELREIVEQATEYKPSIVRFPGGSATSNASRATIRSLEEELSRRGYVWYDWDIPVNDSNKKLRSSAEIAKTIVDGVKKYNGGVVLCHDNHTPATTPEGVAAAIDALLPLGYSFEALPSYVDE